MWYKSGAVTIETILYYNQYINILFMLQPKLLVLLYENNVYLLTNQIAAFSHAVV